MPISPRVPGLLQRIRRTMPQWSIRSKRILIHGINFAPEFIGVAKYTTELARFLASREHDVEVVTALPHYPTWRVQSRRPWRYAVTLEGGLRITRCPLATRAGNRVWRLIAPISFAISSAPVVLWRCFRFRPDTVLCVEPTLFAAPAALLGAKLLGARTVLHVQDLEIDAAFATGYLGSRLLRRITDACERALLARFDAVVTISDSMAARLISRGVPEHRLRVLRNWITPGSPDPQPAPAGIRERLGVPEHVRVVLYAGSLGAKQGLSVLIEAARLLRGDASIRFVVVGDGPMLPTIRAAAASLPNLDVMSLLPQAAFRSLLASADLHLLPQERVAADLVFPSKLGPILASGRPVIATADRGSELARWLGLAAIVTPPGDGLALATAIRTGSAGWDPSRAAELAATLDADVVLPLFAQVLLRPARKAAAVLDHGADAIAAAYLPQA